MGRRLKITCPICSLEFEVDLDELLKQKKVLYRSAASLPEARASRALPSEQGRVLKLTVKCPNGHPIELKVPEPEA